MTLEDVSERFCRIYCIYLNKNVNMEVDMTKLQFLLNKSVFEY